MEGNGIDIWAYWGTYPDTHIRKTYYEWVYQDESCSRVDIQYSVTECVDGEYYNSNFSFEDITEEQLATIEQALMDWHRTGKLVIHGMTVALTYYGENTCIHASKEPPAVNTAELIKTICLRIMQRSFWLSRPVRLLTQNYTITLQM